MIMSIFLVIVGSAVLIWAMLPEIVAAVAGVKENRRCIGIMMLHKAGIGKLSLHRAQAYTIFFPVVFAFYAIVSIIAMEPLLFTYNIVCGFSFYRMGKNAQWGEKNKHSFTQS